MNATALGLSAASFVLVLGTVVKTGNITLFGMSMTEAIDAPRVHHQWLPDLIQPESGALSDEVIEELQAMGYEIKDRRSIGRAAGIMRLDDGRLEGKTDRRARGLALGH